MQNRLSSFNDVNIVTFYGTPEQNSLALFYLQKHMLDLESKEFN